MFEMPGYTVPDFSAQHLAQAPDAVFIPSPADGIAPDNYHASSIYPEYFKIGGQWLLPEDSRMDCVAVLVKEGIAIREFRGIKKGDMIAIGRGERGEDGIYVHMDGFSKSSSGRDQFSFRTGRSRETAYSRDYDSLYSLLRHEREHGYILWVLGPACAFDSDARQAMAALVEQGFVHALHAGNALATHDLEAGLFGTGLGQDIYSQELIHNGHYHHIDVINKVRACGSIPEFIRQFSIEDGIMRACVKRSVPFVLSGSIRDDGPLPEVIADVYQAQDAMRGLVRRATTVICLATQLHTIAIGNMTPSYRVTKDGVRPLYFYTVDTSEFAVNKLRDRGSLSVTGLIANAQDFLRNVARGTGALSP